MASTGARTLRLLSLLQSRRHWSAADLADRLEVSARTVRRDIDRLRDLGYEVESRTGTEGGYQLAGGASLPPLVLGDDEVLALVVALHNLATTGAAGLAEAAVVALARVVPMLPPALRQRAEAISATTISAAWWSGGAPGPSPSTLALLSAACYDGVRVDFEYLDRSGTPSRRRVEPYRLVTLATRWYLLAFDPSRDDWRTFRVDRMSEARPLRNSFDPRPLPGDDPAEFVRAAVGSAGNRHRFEAVVECDAATLGNRFGRWGSIESLGEGRSQVSVTVEDWDWALLVLCHVGHPFTVTDDEARTELLRRARFLADHLDDGAGQSG